MARKRPRGSIVRCPHCGHGFQFGKLACPRCGSDMETGWREDAADSYWSADIPDEFTEEDYREAILGLPGSKLADWPMRRVYLLVVGLLTALAFLLTSI